MHASLSVEDFGEAVSEVLDKSVETSTVRKSVRGPGKKPLSGIRLRPDRSRYLGVGGIDQCVKIPIAESKGLKFFGVPRARWHVIRQDSSGEAGVPENPYNLEEVENALIGIDFGKVVQSAVESAHVDLVDLSPLR